MMGNFILMLEIEIIKVLCDTILLVCAFELARLLGSLFAFG